MWWQTVTDFLSVYSAPFCFHAFARERAALKDATSTVVIVSVSVPELKSRGAAGLREPVAASSPIAERPRKGI